MDRAELERLDRSTLIAQAEALGVARANILTRPELMDELLVRTARRDDRDLPRARGFFGRARDLVARVIEKGLHLPDAAERLRQVSVAASQIASRVVPAVVPTVTLAEIYAAQGHRPRAVETLRRVLELEPDHTAAQALLTKLETTPLTIPPVPPPPPEEDDELADPAAHASADPEDREAPRSFGTFEAAAAAAARKGAPGTPPLVPVGSPRAWAASSTTLTNEHGEPVGFLDDEPLPIRYDVDECVAIAVDPVTLYVYWEIREGTLAHIRRVRPEGTLALRLLIITPSWDGPRSVTRDFDVDSAIADRTIRDLPAGAVVRAAVGWRTAGAFLPIAHAPALETPPGTACPVAAESFVRWTPRGLAPVTALDSDYASIGRALGQLAPRLDGAAPYARSDAPFGSSEISAGFRPGAAAAVEAREVTVPSSESML